METQDCSSTAAVELPLTRPSAVNDEGVQIRCCLDAGLGMFRVLEAKGKALSSGGFGVSIPQTPQPTTTTNTDETEAVEEGVGEEDKKNTVRVANEYLFVEEVVFLHERGLLECLASPPTTTDVTTVDPTCLMMDTAQLFRLLPLLKMSLPMYLVYQHLRSQDFQVLRHDPKRLPLLKRQEELRSIREKVMPIRQEVTGLRHQVRSSIAQAPPPAIPSSQGAALTIAWDTYLPNSQFGKTHPGLPDFYVAVTYYNEPHAGFAQIEELVVKYCHGIPLKLATVSDSGTVVMFGVSNMGVPSIHDGNGD
jgi:hypothetical protein